jgi:hypothetical protein
MTPRYRLPRAAVSARSDQLLQPRPVVGGDPDVGVQIEALQVRVARAARAAAYLAGPSPSRRTCAPALAPKT